MVFRTGSTVLYKTVTMCNQIFLCYGVHASKMALNFTLDVQLTDSQIMVCTRVCAKNQPNKFTINKFSMENTSAYSVHPPPPPPPPPGIPVNAWHTPCSMSTIGLLVKCVQTALVSKQHPIPHQVHVCSDAQFQPATTCH